MPVLKSSASVLIATTVHERLRALFARACSRASSTSSALSRSTAYPQESSPLTTPPPRSTTLLRSVALTPPLYRTLQGWYKTRWYRTPLLAVPLFLNGCWLIGRPPATTPPPQSPTTPIRALNGRSLLKERPEYQAASKAFAAGDKATALRSLEALRGTAGLTPSDQAFLNRQIAICQGKTLQGEGKTPEQQESVPTARSGKPVLGSGDCGPRALLLAASELGVKADLAALGKAAATTSEGTTLEGLVKAAKSIGLKAEGVQVDRDALGQLPTPAIAWWEGNHFVAVLKISQNAFTGEVSATVHDPNKAESETVKLADLLAKSGGIILTLKKDGAALKK